MRTRPRTLLLLLLAWALALAAALALDGWAYAHISDPKVYDRDWGRLLREMGYLPTWILAAAALALHDRRSPDRRGAALPEDRVPRRFDRALLLLAGPTVSGIVGELLKLLIRRERPWAHDGAYVFRPWSDHPLSSAGLSTPSSHALVAFGAAFMLARLFPRAWPVWFLLAIGCAFTRVAAHAHFVSDVVLGAFVAWAVVGALWRWWERRARRRAAGEERA